MELPDVIHTFVSLREIVTFFISLFVTVYLLP